MTESLLSTGALENRLGIPRFQIQRAMNKGVFPYIQDPMTGNRFVPANDSRTLKLLDLAAEIFKTLEQPTRFTFANAVRLAQRGYIVNQEAS